MATTPYPFVAATVLTAQKLNSTFNIPTTTKTASHTLVAADAGTRILINSASATILTVNTSIFAASDIVEIQNIGAGVCTISAGSCSVGTTGTLALVQNAGGRLVFTAASTSIFQADGVAASSSGLTLISATTIGNTVSSVTVSSAFSATYDNYSISISGGVNSVDTALKMTLGATATGYYAGGLYSIYSSASLTATNQSNTAFWTVGCGRTNAISANINLASPNLAKVTTFSTNFIFTATTGDFNINGGFLNDSTAYTAFTITPTSGTLTGGTIRVYGYTNS